MVMKKLEIITMTKEEYFKEYGSDYEDGMLWDYPLEELDHLLEDGTVEVYALIEGRLYETTMELE